jgi:hypothetical protein
MKSRLTIFIIGLFAIVGVCTTNLAQLPITSAKRATPMITVWGLLGSGRTIGIGSKIGEADHAPQSSKGFAAEVSLSKRVSVIVEYSVVEIQVWKHSGTSFGFPVKGGWVYDTEGYTFGAYGRIRMSATDSFTGIVDLGLDIRSVDPIEVTLSTICPHFAVGALFAPRTGGPSLCASVGYQQGCFGIAGSFGIAF